MGYQMKMFKDPTPNGTVNARLIAAQLQLAKDFTDLTQEELEIVVRVVLFTARKVVSVWQHVQAYHAVENELLASPPTQDEIDLSNGLFDNFDDSLVQIKSALDHMIYIMVPIAGAKRWKLRTFGEKGERVVDALNRNLPAHLKGPVPILVKVLESIRPWLEAVIAQRDTINHFLEGGIRLEVFAVYREKDGNIWRPQWGEHTVGPDPIQWTGWLS